MDMNGMKFTVESNGALQAHVYRERMLPPLLLTDGCFVPWKTPQPLPLSPPNPIFKETFRASETCAVGSGALSPVAHYRPAVAGVHWEADRSVDAQ